MRRFLRPALALALTVGGYIGMGITGDAGRNSTVYRTTHHTPPVGAWSGRCLRWRRLLGRPLLARGGVVVLLGLGLTAVWRHEDARRRSLTEDGDLAGEDGQTSCDCRETVCHHPPPSMPKRV